MGFEELNVEGLFGAQDRVEENTIRLSAITGRKRIMLERKTADIETSGSDDPGADRIRIRPDEFTVPSEDPFKNDLLDRKSAIEGLTRIVGSAQSPYVISVDAAWGSGKTAFLNMWCQHLENEGHTVVNFNAWETDFADNPFQALSAEITQRLERFSDSAVRKGIETVKKHAGKAVVAVAQSALRGSGALVPGGTILVEAAISTFESQSGDPISDYQQTRASLREFTESIGHVAETVSGLNDGKPLVVAIDELDRCRPTYAIELIETVKHIFSVENVVFILAINSTALAHSAKSMYGAEFDAERYFRRFFDLQFRLPYQSRESFANALLISTGLQERVEGLQGVAPSTLTLAKSFLSSEEMSLRDAEQAAHRLGLILGMLNGENPWTAFCALIGLSIMEFQPSAYPKFLRGDLADEDLLEILYKNLSSSNHELDQIKPQIDGAAIALTQSRLSGWVESSIHRSSTLIDAHRGTINSHDNDQPKPLKARDYSVEVMHWFSIFWDTLHVKADGSALIEAMRCLELLLPDQSLKSDAPDK